MKPDIVSLSKDIAAISEREMSEFTALRKRLHHAFYYHHKGWLVLSDEDLATLVYGLQYMYAVEEVGLMPKRRKYEF
jgi:hypothetical protein